MRQVKTKNKKQLFEIQFDLKIIDEFEQTPYIEQYGTTIEYFKEKVTK